MAQMAPLTTDARLPGAVSGWTLAEIMVAALILVIIMAGVMSVFTMFMRAWKEGSRDLSLQSSGRLIVEKIVRGPGGRFGLREAAEGHVTTDEDGRGVTFLVDKNDPPTYTKLDDTEVRIYFQDGCVMYDPETAVAGDELPVVHFGRVQDVQFQIEAKAVNIELLMRETSGTIHPSQVKFRTKVFLRKSDDPDTET